MKTSDFQIENQRLLFSEFITNKEFKMKDKITILYKPSVKYNMDSEKKKGVVNLTLDIFDKENIKNYPFYINMVIEGSFKWNDKVSNPEEYLKMNAPAILLSYLRSMVITMTAMAGLPPLNLPLINFVGE